jgi:hypothetical protein
MTKLGDWLQSSAKSPNEKLAKKKLKELLGA